MNRLLKNFLSGIGVRIFNIVATFIATPILLHFLGNAGYGFFILLLGIIGFGGLLDLGLSQSLVREMANKKGHQRQSLYATAAWLYLLLGVIGGIALWMARTPILDHMIRMPDNYPANMTIAMALLAVSLPLKMLTTFANAVLYAVENIHEANVTQVAGTCARFSIASTCAAMHFPLDIVVAAFPISFLVTFFIQIYYLYKIHWLSPWQLHTVKHNHLPGLIQSASGIFLAQASGELALHSDKFIISAVLGAAALAPYNIAYLLAARINDIGSLLASVTFPRIAALFAKKKWHEAWSLYYKSMLCTFFLGLLMIGGIFLFAPWFLRCWIGPTRALPVIPLLLPFLCGTCVGLPSWLNGNMLIALKHSHAVAFSVGTGALFSIPICYFAAKTMGVLGSAWVWAISYAIIASLQAFLLRYYWIHHEH